MFNVNANTLFNHNLFSCMIISDMHEQMTRLYQAAKELRQTEGQTEVAKLLNALPQTLNNWESRGISDKGLLQAQEIIGCDAIWLRDGTGSMVRGGNVITTNYDELLHLFTLFANSTPQGRKQIIRMAESTEKVSAR